MRHVFLNIVVAALIALFATSAEADSVYTFYNIDMFLNEPHPLADKMGTRWNPIQPLAAPVVPQRRINSGAGQPPPAPVSRMAPPIAQPAAASTRQSALSGSASGIISEVRVGALFHDEGPFSRREEKGYDLNIEFLFVSPKFLEVIWAPRPHIGANINTSGDTSQLYMGLSYNFDLWGPFFAVISFGGAIHNGTKEFGIRGGDTKELGCRTLFRESLEFGFRFRGQHSLSAMFDHISNIKICDKNESLENIGIRYGYSF